MEFNNINGLPPSEGGVFVPALFSVSEIFLDLQDFTKDERYQP